MYIEQLPSVELRQWVEKIWYCYSEKAPDLNLTIPLPNHELVIDLRQSYTIRKVGEQNFEISNIPAWIQGLQSKSYISNGTGRHEMLGVLFKTNGLRRFVKYAAAEFGCKFISADQIFGNAIKELTDKVQEAFSITKKIALVDAFLLKNLTQPSPPYYLNQSMIQLETSFGNKGAVQDLCNYTSITNKTLIKNFKQYLGISPLKYAHLKVINRAINEIANNPNQSLTQLAYHLNFFDQAHFIKLFKSITSLTPSEYAHHIINERVDPMAPNFITLAG